MKPEQAACTSKEPMLRIPTMSQIRFAVDGNTKSGVVVAQISRSTFLGAVFVFCSSPRTASAPMCEVPSPSPLRIWRSLMPVRSVIQASEVSTMRASSALVSTCGGTYPWTAVIAARMGFARFGFGFTLLVFAMTPSICAVRLT